MQNLIPLLYMIVAVCIFAAGVMVGRETKEPKQEGSFFTPLPTPPKMEDVPAKQQEKEDVSNRFFK